jgi:hypothetical protein
MTLLRKSKTTLPAIFVLALLLLGVAGFSYAMWSETFVLNGTITTGRVCAEFRDPLTISDSGNDQNGIPGTPPTIWPITKNIANTTGHYLDSNGDNCNDTLTLAINNAYPHYYVHVDFWIHNCGSIPWKIQNITLQSNYETKIIWEGTEEAYLDFSGDGIPDMWLLYGDNFGDQRDPCQSFDLSLGIIILQEAPPGQTFTFSLGITVVQWNEYVEPVY